MRRLGQFEKKRSRPAGGTRACDGKVGCAVNFFHVMNDNAPRWAGIRFAAGKLFRHETFIPDAPKDENYLERAIAPGAAGI